MQAFFLQAQWGLKSILSTLESKIGVSGMSPNPYSLLLSWYLLSHSHWSGLLFWSFYQEWGWKEFGSYPASEWEKVPNILIDKWSWKVRFQVPCKKGWGASTFVSFGISTAKQTHNCTVQGADCVAPWTIILMVFCHHFVVRGNGILWKTFFQCLGCVYLFPWKQHMLQFQWTATEADLC